METMMKIASMILVYSSWVHITQSEGSSTQNWTNHCPQNLSLLITLTRHGVRTPYNRLDGDPNNNFWADGLAQLTNEGKMQLFILGQMFRTQYSALLSEKYIPNEIEVKSTSMDRTIMSAQCFLAGLYPPKGTQVWNTNLSWQPVPVYLLDYNVDQVSTEAINRARSSCLNANVNMLDEVYEQYKTTIKAVEKATGVHYDCLDMKFENMLDVFVVQNFYNLTLPFGLNSVQQDIINLTNATFVKSYTIPEVASIINGQLLDDIVQHLEKYKSKSLPQKVLAYFVHDVNILPFLSTFTDYEPKKPSFAASLTIEVCKIKDLDYISIIYRDSPLSNNEPQMIRNCGKTCPLDKFLTFAKSAAVQPVTMSCPCYSSGHTTTPTLLNGFLAMISYILTSPGVK